MTDIASVQPLPPEAELLLAMARPTLTPERVEECWKLIGGAGLDWGRFVDLAARHKLLPLVGRHVYRYGFHRRRGDAVLPYPWLFVSAYHTNRERNLALMDEWAHVTGVLNDSGLRYAIRKGPVLVERAYGDVGVRRMADLDILVDRADLELVHEGLTRAGYTQGRVSEDGQRIESFARTTQLFWKVNLNNDLPFIKIGHRAHVPTFDIDVCLGIFQLTSGLDVPVTELLDGVQPIRVAGAQTWGLGYVDALVDLCAHLHKEATSRYYIEQAADLEISKFLDVALTCAGLDPTNWERFVERVEHFGAARIVHYALHFTDVLYPGHVPADVLDRLRPDDLAYLDEYGELDGRVGRWSIPFPHRLFALQRVAEAGRSTIPKS